VPPRRDRLLGSPRAPCRFFFLRVRGGSKATYEEGPTLAQSGHPQNALSLCAGAAALSRHPQPGGKACSARGPALSLIDCRSHRQPCSDFLLMRHKNRNCRAGQDSSCSPAKEEFAHTRMPITAHHKHAGRAFRSVRQNCAVNVDIDCQSRLNVDL
jgi:hypothetical protein